MKVLFDLNSVDGYPPIQTELLNVERVDDNLFRIVNTPYFVEDIAYGDIVAAVESDVENQFNFLFVEKNSTYTSISIIILDDGIAFELNKLFSGHNCIMEYGEFNLYRVLAVAIPESSPYFIIRAKLEKLERLEKISFSELALAHTE